MKKNSDISITKKQKRAIAKSLREVSITIVGGLFLAHFLQETTNLTQASLGLWFSLTLWYIGVIVIKEDV